MIGRSIRRTLVLVAALGLAGCLVSSGMLFRPMAKTPDLVLAAPEDPAVVRYRLVEMDVPYFEKAVLPVADDPYGPPSAVRLNLFHDVRVIAALSVKGSADPSGPRVLSGDLPGVEGGMATLTVEGKSLSGTVWVGPRLFRIGPAGAGRYRIEEMDSRRFSIDGTSVAIPMDDGKWVMPSQRPRRLPAHE